MTDPTVPPAESRAQRRARLLRETRRAEQSINESLVDHSESEQDIRRRRIDAEIEKSFPGVTEDEQNPTGQYMPDPRWYARGQEVDPSPSSYYGETHEPMRRKLHGDPQRATDFTSADPTLGGEVAPWTQEEEEAYLRAKRIAENTIVTGTGEWAESLTPDEIEEHSGYAPFEYSQAGWTSEDVESALDTGHEVPLSDQDLWVRGELDSRRSASYYEVPTTRDVQESRANRIQLFRGDVLPEIDSSQHAPYRIDERNVREWAHKHRKEVSETGIEDTEWKQRFDKLKEDIKNTNVPINPQVLKSEANKTLALGRVSNVTQKHIEHLDNVWANLPSLSERVVDGVTYLTPRGTQERVASRRRTRRTNGPRRRNIEGVARSFANQDDETRGATTGRGNLTHYGDHSSAYSSTGRLDLDRLRRDQRPGIEYRNIIYSYDTPIAWRQRNGNVIVPTQRYSKTTNRHQRAVHNALTDAGYHSPQQIANNMMMAAYQQDRHKQTAGSPVGFKHYVVEHGAHDYIPNEEEATSFAHGIANARYDTIRAKQRENAAASGRRPRNSRKPFTRRQQLRLEDAGQLRLPFEGVMPDAERVYNSERGTFGREETYAQRNKKIMQYPITLGYSPQARPNVED